MTCIQSHGQHLAFSLYQACSCVLCAVLMRFGFPKVAAFALSAHRSVATSRSVCFLEQ